MENLVDVFGWSGWNAVQSFGTLITAVIAWFVFLEARSIKQLQWLSQAADKWQEFNRLLVDGGHAERWEAIRSGLPLGTPMNASDKRLLLMYFNIQMVEYHLIRSRILPKSVLRAMQAELAALGKHAEFVHSVLDNGGYDPRYVQFVRDAMDGTLSAPRKAEHG
jgi:hypothetical protein